MKKSPLLNHLTRERSPGSPGRRKPTKAFLKSSFNENDIQNIDNKELNSKMNGFAGPPPPVLKKPEIPKKPAVAKKPVVAGKPTTNANSAFRDSLSKKLAVPFPGKVPGNSGSSRNAISGMNKNSNTGNNVNAIAKELEGILNQQQSKHVNHDNPKSDRTLSLTEVSTLRTEEKSNRQMNDTLEIMTDEGFDTTGDDYLMNLNGDVDLSPDEDDDELFAGFNIPPPPPPAVDFSDSEWDDSIMSKERRGSNLSVDAASISSGESLSCAFEAFVPPPPPPNLMDDTDDESGSDGSDFGDVEIPDFGDVDIPDFTDQTADNDSINSFGTIIRKPVKLPEVPNEETNIPKTVNAVKPDLRQNLLVGELKGVLRRDSGSFEQTRNLITNSVPLGFENDNIGVDDRDSPLLNDKYFSPTPKIPQTDLKTNNDALLKEMNNITSFKTKETSPKMQQRTVNPVLDKLQGNLKNKNDNVLREINRLNFNNSLTNDSETSSSFNKQLLPFEVDSGHGTARSGEVSDSEKNSSQSNSKPNSVILVKKPLTQQRNSKTWSSCSSGLDDAGVSNAYDDYDDDESEMTQPKVNLRDLLKKMKSFESDTEDDFTLDIKPPPQKNTFDRQNSLDFEDEDDSVHFTDSDVETHLNDLEVDQWSMEDVCEWLDLIGLSHLKNVFTRNKIDGKALARVDMKLLESMDITSSEDKEMILSEVYALQNPGDVDLEVSMLDQLDKASGEEKEKMLSFLSALQAPSNESFINSYKLSTTKHQDEQKPNGSVPVQEDIITMATESEQQSAMMSGGVDGEAVSDVKMNEEQRTIEMMKRLAEDVFDPSMEDDSSNHLDTSKLSSPGTEKSNNKKKAKKKGFFASLRKGKGKKSKSSTTSTSDGESENALGTIKVVCSLKQLGKEETIPLLVSMKTTSKEVCSMCLEYLSLHEDVNCYHIAISRYDKKIEFVELNSDEYPLVFQSKWDNMNTYRFELKCKVDAIIIVNNDDNDGMEELSSTKIGISSTTRVSDILPVLVKKFKRRDKPELFRLKQPDKDDFLNGSCVLLSLPPALGYKFHVFKLINTSPRATQVNMEQKKLETKCALLEKQILVLNNQIVEHKSNDQQLKAQNQNLNDVIGKRNEEIKALQNELTNLNLTEKTRQLVSPSQEKELQLTNSNLNEELQNVKHQTSHLEHVNKTLREEKLAVQKERDQFADQNKELLKSLEETKSQLEHLQSEKKYITADSSGQMKKLYTENKELLKTVQSLEERLSDAQYKYSQLQMEQETDGVENTELRLREETLENQVLEKDSKILEIEYKLQKKDRSIRELEDQLEEENRKRKKEIETKETFERRIEDLLLKLDNSKQQLNEKEKQIQSVKSQLNKQEKKLTKQRTIMEQEKYSQNEELQNLRLKTQSEIAVLQEKIQSLQKINVEKSMVQKQKEFELTKKNEEYEVLLSDYERKLSSKDVLIERLEKKVAKVDVNIESKLQDQLEICRSKENKIHELEMEVARIESEHASKLREATNTLRSKENVVAKLETRIKKLDANNRDGAKKFEKFSSEKDRLLTQMNEDRDKEVKDLKTRLRHQEERLGEKEKELKEITRKSNDYKKSYDTRLKKRDKEFKQQKYLLEKILDLVNTKAPSLLRQLQDTIDDEQSSGRSSRRNQSRMEGDSNSVEDEWC